MDVSNKVQGTTDWVRRFHPAPDADSRLVCFPHAGGAASYYHGVSASLSPDVDVLAMQYPGRQDRRTEPCLRTIDELAAQSVQALAPWTDRPLTLFGHSMGAMVAFEVARRLVAEGTVPLSLIVSGRRAPSRTRQENVHLQDDAGVLAEMQRLDGTESRLLDDEELRALFLPVIRSDYQAVETYRYVPGAPLPCPVLTLTGDADPVTDIDEANAWGEHTVAGFELRVFPGGHFFLNRHAATVTDLIRSRIAPSAV
ncbi:thioesterase II family protein [Streptomyces sp. NPDC054786]